METVERKGTALWDLPSTRGQERGEMGSKGGRCCDE